MIGVIETIIYMMLLLCLEMVNFVWIRKKSKKWARTITGFGGWVKSGLKRVLDLEGGLKKSMVLGVGLKLC